MSSLRPSSRRKNVTSHHHRPGWRKRHKAILSFQGLETRWLMATFTVANTGDNGGVNPAPFAGTGTLRQAIVDSNATPGSNTISINIGTGVQTISLQAALPSITVPVVIDGTSQPGYAGSPLIDIDGTSAGSSATGLDLAAGSGGSTILSLVINNFGTNGISIESTGNAVQSSYIGTNAAGTAAGSAAMSYGVFVTGASNTIGGMTPGAGNLISGNTTNGVRLTGASATGNVVEGNLIGTDVTGTVTVANGDGVEVDPGASGNTIGGLTATPGTGAGNVISGSTLAGVYVVGPTATGNLVEGNLIGTNDSGTGALGNIYGIYINNSGANTVGGTVAGAGNVLSGNSFDGVLISGLTAASTNLHASRLACCPLERIFTANGV
jgi:hypothetical protein